MTQVTKAWGNRLSPKLEKKKVKSKVALMKVRTNFEFKCHLIIFCTANYKNTLNFLQLVYILYVCKST